MPKMITPGSSDDPLGGVTTGLVGPGEQVTWRAKHFGLWHDLTSKATVVEPPTYFQENPIDGDASNFGDRSP